MSPVEANTFLGTCLSGDHYDYDARAWVLGWTRGALAGPVERFLFHTRHDKCTMAGGIHLEHNRSASGLWLRCGEWKEVGR